METYSNYNVVVILVAAFGSLFAGYAGSVIVATVGQPTFYSSLNLVEDPTAPGYAHTDVIIGAVNGVFSASAFLGAFLAGYGADKFGRLGNLRLAAIIGVIGGVIQTASVNVGMYILARVLTGLSTGHTGASMGPYFSEVAPPHSRGLMAGAHGSIINLGYALSAWVGFACFHASGSTFGWRFPNAVLVIIALCLLAGTAFLPESPRWLVSRGQDDKALAVLCRLHRDTADPENHFAQRELALIKMQEESDHTTSLTDGRWQLFSKPTYRRRLILALMLVAGSQNTGILVINNYNTLLYKSLGLTTTQALAVGGGYNTLGFIANVIGATVSDRLGRRKILVAGFGTTMAMFVIATALIAKYSETQSVSYATAAVVFLFLYVSAYASGIDVQMWTVASEIFPSHLRAHGNAVAISSLYLVDVLWLTLAPTATAAIGWKYYLVFICLGTLHTAYLYVKLPETANLPLEEIDALFGKEVVGHIEDVKLEQIVAIETAKVSR